MTFFENALQVLTAILLLILILVIGGLIDGCVYVVDSESVYINDRASTKDEQQHQQTHTTTHHNRDRHDTHENDVKIDTDLKLTP